MKPVFIDTNIPMYAAGTPHPLRDPCQAIIRAVAEGKLKAVTDAEVLQEILYRYLHIGEWEKGLMVFDLFRRIMLGHILPLDEEDVQRARELAEEYPRLSPRDLIHLAVMLRHGLHEIISADRGFDRIREIRRLEPAEFARRLA